MRRLPVFFVLDCSESMIGENYSGMENGFETIVRSLRTNPHALETVHIAVIAFAGIAKTIAPLLELVSFYPPKLPIGSGTNLGEALDVLMKEIDKSVTKTTQEVRGDWRPIIYLFTDGKPTDNSTPAIEKWKKQYASGATMVAVGLGQAADFKALRELTENVILFENSEPGDFTKFIDWITASVLAQSKSVREGTQAGDVINLDKSIMTLVDEQVQEAVDETCAVFVGRCQKTKKPYLVKYEQKKNLIVSDEDRVALGWYELDGCFPLTEDYFKWSGNTDVELRVNTSELIGTPSCPHCGNSTAFAMCSCGKLLCIDGPGDAICPWCQTGVRFAPAQENEQGFDVGRRSG